MGAKLRDHYQAFAIVATLTKTHTTPIVLLPSSVVGLEAWNAARRPSKSLVKRAFNRPSMNVITPGTPGGSSNASDVELDRGGGGGGGGGAGRTSGDSGSGGLSGWLSGGRRSRSNTTVTAVVLAPGERTEQERRAAGAGSGLLGTGLLRCVVALPACPLCLEMCTDA